MHALGNKLLLSNHTDKMRIQMSDNLKIKLQVSNLDFIYNQGVSLESEVEALQNINLSIYENEIISLIGPSGCGKTTLLMLMAGLMKPTRGEILLEGNRITGPGRDRAVVFQEDAVFPWLTVEENIEYGPKLHGVDPENRRELVKQYVNLVGLQGFEKRFPRELSGGMKKRVDLARCYANNPDVLFMDEPFGALDAMTKEKMQIDLLNLWIKEQKTICFVTHDIEEAIYLSKKVVIFSARPGRIKKIVDIPFGKERPLHIKVSPEFQEYRKDMMETLQAEMQ